MVLKKGDKGSAVKKLQEVLGLKIDGDFGSITEEAVRKYQKSKGLLADGVVGSKTAESLGFKIEDYISTDLSTSSVSRQNVDNTQTNSYTTQEGLTIQKYYLDSDEYVNDKTKKYWLFLHHTAGGHNPFSTVKQWNNDTRGRIATQYVIGNISTTNGDSTYDGVVVETFPDEDWAYHLGNNGNSHLHPESVGIEICSYGFLTKKDGKYYTYVNSVVPEDQVCDLGFDFNGHRYYHKYSDKQIQSLGKLIKEIVRRHPDINLDSGLKNWLKTQSPKEAFGYKDEAFYGRTKGLLTHTNVRKDKTDCQPQDNLVELIKSL